MKRYRVVLSIAGSDSGGGAGIQADIKTISAMGCYAATAITAVTAQNTTGVHDIIDISPGTIANQVKCVLEDIGANSIKIGMLSNETTVKNITSVLAKYSSIPIVLDPVMVATSGDRLLEPIAIEAIVSQLFPVALLVTPNIHEAKILANQNIETIDDMKIACQKIHSKGAKNVLLKGGDLKNGVATDILLLGKSGELKIFEAQRIETKNTHGTGCTYSSAIASLIAKGNSLVNSIQLAKDYISKAILYGKDYEIGTGRGPVCHFWAQEE